VNNSCICPSTKNISQVTNKCVTCNVANCYKCSTDDICDLFLPVIPSPANISSNSTGNVTGGNNTAQNGTTNATDNTGYESGMIRNNGNVSDSVNRIESIVIVLVSLIAIIFMGLVVFGVVLMKLIKGSASISINNGTLR
jgi:hypothetical protein